MNILPFASYNSSVINYTSDCCNFDCAGRDSTLAFHSVNNYFDSAVKLWSYISYIAPNTTQNVQEVVYITLFFINKKNSLSVLMKKQKLETIDKTQRLC